jgi:hypothetical protein
LKQAFELFDKNNDGTINLSEMKEVMKTLGRDPSEEELKGKSHCLYFVLNTRETSHFY